MRIVFYDDNEKNISNIMLVNKIKKQIPNANVNYINTVAVFEAFLDKAIVDAFVLDIMGPETNLTEFDTKKKVESTCIGIELLRRIRKGFYRKQKKTAPVIIRTAKQDSNTSRVCLDYGAIVILRRGENKKLVNILKDITTKPR